MIVDDGESAKHLDRPGLQRALGMLKQGEAAPPALVSALISSSSTPSRTIRSWTTAPFSGGLADLRVNPSITTGTVQSCVDAISKSIARALLAINAAGWTPRKRGKPRRMSTRTVDAGAGTGVIHASLLTSLSASFSSTAIWSSRCSVPSRRATTAC